MRVNGVRFSIDNYAAWAPGVSTIDAWKRWAASPFPLIGDAEPNVAPMPVMLRRRAGFLGKMALEVSYQCLGDRTEVPTVFCSRHGEVSRAVDLLTELARDGSVSPTGFGLAVHNASAGLFSIARKDQANHIALASGKSTVEHAVIEACGLLADGAPMVMLVTYDHALPPVFASFQDCDEQSYAWAWLMVPAQENAIHLSWDDVEGQELDSGDMPGGLEVLRFQIGEQTQMQRIVGKRRWLWSRHA
ncbi:beta-ketoacyl synthase chain length factor [Undibacterium sp. Ji42W]|uniref:beta-ketoacyl synthase chain length factor n=1 Tax=Undibacterium sp. Ji42W TaxID=3413039 RepID=UPI003BEF9C7E